MASNAKTTAAKRAIRDARQKKSRQRKMRRRIRKLRESGALCV